ncbi:hypothetical protein GCM10022415_27650 [Knoellia locipacati]
MTTKDADFLYCVVRDWNWADGTWLLKWVASQTACTRATAQLIFWTCQPETFLPTSAGRAQLDSEEFDLADLVLQRWKAGLYASDPRNVGDRLRTVISGRHRFRADDGTWCRPNQVGWFHPANPVPMMESYRAAEARCDPSAVPWQVPDDLGRIQRDRRPSYTAYDVESVLDEFAHLIEDGERE